MRITFHDHGGKGARIAAALHAAGHETVPGGGDIAVIDHDYYSDICDAHEVVVLYPHGGNPNLDWDGKALHPHVRLNLVHGPGHAEVCDAYGLPVPSIPVGWCYGDLAEPRYPVKVRSVLFAPLHPLANGYMPAAFADVNRRTLATLLASDLDVSVRIFGSAAGFGLDPAAPVRWVPGGSLAHADIDAVDLVVSSEGTVLTLAVARGAPTIAFGSDLAPDLGHDGPVTPPGWAGYRHLYRYPYDIADAPLPDLIDAVAGLVSDHRMVADWRDRFVGHAFNPGLAVKLIEAAVSGALDVGEGAGNLIPTV